ncbi:MAG: glutaredoxin family protein [Candidatus Brocadiales bacterium]|nr:thioredoxin family protein [Candidatus Bathyanammoxibius sp.]MCQ4574857.1 glutaredoxin family protein [Candidatus Bathyanammoxibius amoris]
MTEVKVYTSSGCGSCKQVKKYLQKADIEFKELDICKDEEAIEELKRLGAMTVPCIVAGEMVIRGFDKTKLDELIACLTADVCT